MALILVLMQFSDIREAFGITMPETSDLMVILGFGVIVFISMEVVKMVIRRRTSAKVKAFSIAP